MKSIGYNLPGLPGLLPPAAKTYARYPVWKNSTSQPVKVQRLVSRREAGLLYARAKRLDRRTKLPGQQDGSIGRNGLAILHTLLFTFMHWGTGRLDPSQQSIANDASISLRSVARGLVKLKAAGVLIWARRCRGVYNDEGRFERRQQSNLYTIQPVKQWRGFAEPEPPPVEPWQIGATPPLDPIDEAVAAFRAKAAPEVVVERYRLDPTDRTALAWSSFLGALLKG